MIRLCALLLSLFAIPAAWSKDVATEQFNVTAAREHYQQVQSEYAALTQRVEMQVQRVTQEQARLEALQKDQKAAKARLEAAKGKLKQRELALDKAWGN
jgi:septal ring factor EnvC (AmiA/AmiB activator)